MAKNDYILDKLKHTKQSNLFYQVSLIAKLKGLTIEKYTKNGTLFHKISDKNYYSMTIELGDRGCAFEIERLQWLIEDLNKNEKI